VDGLELKKLSPESIPRSLERVNRYRLMNQPSVAESICRDILAIDSANQDAVTGLILALTDQFSRHHGPGLQDVLDLIGELAEEYDSAYFTGLACERQAKARLAREYPGAKFDAYDLLHDAMEWYEKADALRATGNEDARLHWNTCVRVIQSERLHPRPMDDTEPAHD
jgi:hypothetical protein